MKKIVLSEDQLNRLVLNEGYFDSIENVYNLASSNVNVGLHPAANLPYEELCDQIYTALKGLGTDEDSLLSVLQQVPDLPSLRKLINTFASERPGETLLDWIDSDIDGDSNWAKFWPAFRQMKSTSEKNGHLVEPVKKANEMDMATIGDTKRAFPCIEDTPGFDIQRTDSSRGIVYFKAESGSYGINKTGSLWKFDDQNKKFVPQQNKVSCPVTADTANINEGLSGLTEQSDTNWVTSFQQQLSDAGYGADLGSAGIDGKLGPKTATAAYKLLVAKGIIKSSSEVTPKEDGTEPKQDGTQPQQDINTNPVQNSPGNGGLQGLSESINHFRRLIK